MIISGVFPFCLTRDGEDIYPMTRIDGELYDESPCVLHLYGVDYPCLAIKVSSMQVKLLLPPSLRGKIVEPFSAQIKGLEVRGRTKRVNSDQALSLRQKRIQNLQDCTLRQRKSQAERTMLEKIFDDTDTLSKIENSSK